MPTSRPGLRVAALALALAAGSAPAVSGTLGCGGTVEKVAYHASTTTGGLMIKMSSMNVPVFICSPDAEWVVSGAGYKTQPASCKAIYASLLAAKLSGATLDYVHFDGDAVPTSCTGWASWSSANVRYYAY